MLLLQRANYKYIMYFTIGLLILLPIITQASNINKKNNEIEYLDVRKLINKSTLECSFDTSSEKLIIFYEYLMENPIKKTGYEKFTIGERYKVSGVKLISSTLKKNKYENSINMDTDFKKFGVRILRISSFTQEGEYENFGYYIILKNSPAVNKTALEKQKINIKYSVIEETRGGNTKIRCILAG